jgi:hypothetical protein
VVIGMLVIGTGFQLDSVEHWHEILSTKFVAGWLIQVGGAIVALFTRSVQQQHPHQTGRNPVDRWRQ